MDTTSDGYPYPLPTDPADLSGQLQALAEQADADFCPGGQLDLSGLFAPPGYVYSNAALISVPVNTTTSLTMATRQFNNLHQGATAPGPVTFDLPTDPSGVTLASYIVGCSIRTSTATLTSGTARQLFMNVSAYDPFLNSSTVTQYVAKHYGLASDCWLLVQQMIVAYSGTVSWQFLHANTGASLSIGAGEARCWVYKVFPHTGPVRTT